MARITNEQVRKWNAKMGQGFEFDVQYFIFHSGEKVVYKSIPIDGGGYIMIRLLYCHEWKTVRNEYGCRFNLNTGRWIPKAHVSKFVPTGTEGCWSGFGLGSWIDIGDPVEKRSFNLLMKLTHDVDLKKLAGIGELEPETLVGSKSFPA